MPSVLHVALLPQLLDDATIDGSVTVMIDVLRASTTMILALEAGASEFLPVVDVEEARQIKETADSPEKTLLGGERGGLALPGFDLGNSPREYSAERVAGKSIVFTTSNGTNAIAHAAGKASSVLIGAFANRTAVVKRLTDASHVVLLCAGTHGQISREDVLCAGAMAESLRQRSGWSLDDQAWLAVDAWRAVTASPLEEEIRKSLGGSNLERIGQDADIPLAAKIDACQAVPELVEACPLRVALRS